MASENHRAETERTVAHSGAQAQSPEDPCESAMQKYEQCVASHTLGMKNDDDCRMEAEFYKACRRAQRKKQLNQG